MINNGVTHGADGLAGASLPLTLLLIEDNHVDATLIEAMLAEALGDGFSCTRVKTLSHGLATLAESTVSCVLLDLNLRDSEGLGTLDEVLVSGSEPAVVVLTGLNDDRTGHEAMAHGAQDYLVKGNTDADRLSRAIRYAVERKRVERALRHQALHDALTGVANRAMLVERTRAAIARRARHKGYLVLLVVDLDRFKWINDSLGHPAGDELLIAVARRIEGAVRPFDLVARLGGDEFVVLCEDVASEFVALDIAERIEVALGLEFALAEATVRVGASIGIVMSADAATRPEMLLRDADVAMYRAKERGKGRCELFDGSMRRSVQERVRAENDLHRALADDQFVVHYQPIVDLTDGHLVAVEALVRCQLPDGTLVSAGSFIEVAEESGLIVLIGDYVLRTACRQLARWEAVAGSPHLALRLNVNVSPRELADPDLVGRLARILGESGANPNRLCLELTETSLLVEPASLERLKPIKALDVGLSIDDFGTGYSSLSRLTDYPVDELKIDRSFIRGLGRSDRDTAVVEAVVALGQTLGLAVVAEGVETEAQATSLRELKCLQAQGYLTGRPVAHTDLKLSNGTHRNGDRVAAP
jgi:diguanylate cyclase (GGDEF)-like protein